MEMAHSGGMFDLSALAGCKVDKHSTGGVADTTTLILAPLVASVDVPVVKMSGRGLGFSGGTIDKLESIPGFRVDVTEEEALRFAKESGIVLMSQTDNLTPADKKLYALRDVTGTVDSIPLIAASIMSEKNCRRRGCNCTGCEVRQWCLYEKCGGCRKACRHYGRYGQACRQKGNGGHQQYGTALGHVYRQQP